MPYDWVRPQKVTSLTNLPAEHVIGLIITAGKALSEACRKPGRISLGEVVIHDRFA